MHVPVVVVVSVSLLALICVQRSAGRPAPAYSPYTVTDLGDIVPRGVDQTGEVVGSEALPGPTANLRVRHAVLWKNGQFHDLGTLGGDDSEAYGINRRGAIVGWAATVDQDEHACLWQNGSPADLGTMSGSQNSRAYSINTQDQIVGFTNTRSGFDHACLWHKGHLSDLGALSGFPSTEARSINDSGIIVGTSSGEVTGARAFWDKQDTMRSLGTLASAYVGGGIGGNVGQGFSSAPTPVTSRAYAVNDQNEVVGESNGHAFIWTAGAGMKALDSSRTLAEGVGSAAYGINDNGEIVGSRTAGSGETHGCIWHNGIAVDLNTLIAAGAGWTIGPATANNDHGQIVGIGTLNGKSRAYLMTPPNQ